MRPKVVILTLVAAFAALGIIAVLRDVRGNGPGGDTRTNGTDGKVTAMTNPSDTNHAAAPIVGSQPPVVSEEVRQALIDKELEQIDDLRRQVDGTNNLLIINALIEKFSNPEAEVRHTALRVVKEMNDTNAVPGLQKAVDSTTDPREKVAIMDAIDYIKMPSITDNVAPELATNHQDPNLRAAHVQINPAFIKGNKNPNGANNNQ
jgi:hypothetical protein